MNKRNYQGKIDILRYSAAEQFMETRQLSISPTARPVGFSVSEDGQTMLYTLELLENAYGDEYTRSAFDTDMVA